MSDPMPPRDVPEKFLVAFSFAGEQRDLVWSIAEALEKRLGRSTVFLDEWYKHYIAGDGADKKLQKIYRKCWSLSVFQEVTALKCGHLSRTTRSVTG